MGAAFLLILIGFAWIYWLLRADFYHSTAQYEPQVASDGQRVLDAIHASVVENYPLAHLGSTTIAIDSMRGDVSAVTFTRPSADASGVHFRATVRLDRDPSLPVGAPGPLQMVDQIDVIVPIDLWLRIQSDTGEARVLRYISVEGAGSQSTLPVDLFVAQPSVGEPAAPVLDLPESVDDQLVAYWNGVVRGSPIELSDSGWRSLYLSAMTITTVGFGDIVPLTTRTRFLVGLEAVLGVLLAGLYLWAITSPAHTSGDSRWQAGHRPG